VNAAAEQQDAADKRRAIGALRAPSLMRRLQLILVLGRLTEVARAIAPSPLRMPSMASHASPRGLVRRVTAPASEGQVPRHACCTVGRGALQQCASAAGGLAGVT
jgi:hypothetical protein